MQRTHANVEITTGGTDGPRARDALLARSNNLYAELFDESDSHKVAQSFAAAGWRARDAGGAYEVEHTWALLLIKPASPILLSGILEPACVDDLISVIHRLGYRTRLELYGDDGQLLEIRTSHGLHRLS